MTIFKLYVKTDQNTWLDFEKGKTSLFDIKVNVQLRLKRFYLRKVIIALGDIDFFFFVGKMEVMLVLGRKRN